MDQTEKGKANYQELVKEVSPPSHLAMDCLKAFVIGGLICVLGQFFNNFFMNSMNFPKDKAGTVTSIALILISIFLTGLGVYEKIGKFAGAGSVVPITGFANSVASPAIEFKKEGFILGLGAKMFVVAGPVIVYGTLTSILVGSIYYFMK